MENENIQLTRAELAILRLWLARESADKETMLNVDLNTLYGKINMLYNEACKAERAAAT
jgi:hypothetical protein